MRRRHIAALVATLADRPDLAGRVLHAMVLHDPDCTPARCVCEPEIILEEATPERLADGAERQRAWLRRVCS